MKFTGDIAIPAPREAVYAKVRDARFFASCVEGVQQLNEIDGDHYTAVLETKVAYLKFKFNVVVEVVRADPPREIEAKIEGTPLGIVGRLTATSLTRLAEDGGGTKVSYEIEAALTGKLGSLACSARPGWSACASSARSSRGLPLAPMAMSRSVP
jgi:carbon monoxide dehydrogenase subunit G